MELGDSNEFEFDLSDVDVAAFESVATEDTSTLNQEISATSQEEQQLPKLQELPQQQDQSQPQLQPPQPPPPHPQSQPQPQHLTQVSSPATLTPQPGRILLVPISKTSTSGIKQLFQLSTSGTTPITALTTTGNKKQIIQLAPISASNLNVGKNNYSFPITATQTITTTTTTSQLLPGSSQGGHKQLQIQLQPQTQQHQPQQIYITTTNSSPLKHQNLSINSVLNKSLNNLQNNSSITTHFSSANLSSSRNISYNDSLRAPTPNSNAANEVPKRKPCNCTKSQCLKLYCDCFANGEFCSGCNCTNCFNSLEKEKERQKAITQCLERNPEAFRPKIGKAVKMSIGEPAPEAIERRHTKGCNCKRSGCLKNYCECYEAKILCSNLCKCCGCKNYEESFERKSLMQLANSASENARGILKNLLPTNNNSNTGKEFTKCFITDEVIHASLVCLLQSAQQAEKDGTLADNIPNLIQTEMGRCLRMIVDSATDTSKSKKR